MKRSKQRLATSDKQLVKLIAASSLFAVCFSLPFTGCARARIIPTRSGEYHRGVGAEPFSITPPLQKIPVGEELEYQVSWWGIPVATAVLRSSHLQEKTHRDLVHLSFEAKSNWALQTFYPVRVRLSSRFDPQTLSPRRFESYLKRRWYVHESVITFDPAPGMAVHELQGEKEGRVSIQPTTQDGLSMLYYVRTLPLQLGKTILLEIAADGKNWALKGRIVRAHMVRIGNLGDWPAVEGRVELAYPVPFFHGAQAKVWFSADQDRIPLLARIHSRIGPVTVVLTRRKTARH